MIFLTYPDNINDEKTKGILDWLELIMLERFGHTFSLSQKSSSSLTVQLPSSLGEIVFDRLIPSFYDSNQNVPYGEIDVENEGFKSVFSLSLPAPGLGGSLCSLIDVVKGNNYIHYDILGLVYWVLSRQEEVNRKNLDKHGRFPAISSHAYKYHYLDRPIVDEWLDIFGQVIKRQWPQLQLKKHKPKTFVSCDVDQPYLPYSKSFLPTFRKMLGDLIKRRSFRQATNNIRRYFWFKRGKYELDPLIGAIDWIMDVNERAGNEVAFYFITQQKGSSYNSYYEMEEGVIRYLLKLISSKGHEIGLHGSYNSYRDGKKTFREENVLRYAMSVTGVFQDDIGGRQHYLRWESPITAKNLEAAGITYDSSLGYADHPGFRCGTCHEFPMFDPVKGEMLAIRQRPLVLMECSVLSPIYMGMGYTDEALKYMNELKQRCYKVGGNFTLLWHNSHLLTDEDKSFYLSLIGSEVEKK
ncbi:MAG: hypothetical protein AXW17_13275 [Colwellia sp. Phe_37]|nr:MAG: hypothetical protein AXW17_13275 [Colwellia sp. Phe_37]